MATSSPVLFVVLVRTDEVSHACSKPHWWLAAVLFTPFILSLFFFLSDVFSRDVCCWLHFRASLFCPWPFHFFPFLILDFFGGWGYGWWWCLNSFYCVLILKSFLMAEDSDVRLLLDNFPSACSFCSEWLNVQLIPKRCKKLHTNVCFDSATGTTWTA